MRPTKAITAGVITLGLVASALALAEPRVRHRRPIDLPQQRIINQRNVIDNGMRQQRAMPAMASPSIHIPHEGPITAAAIRTAIDDAALFLRSRQTPDGAIGEAHYAPGGATALAALALLAAGADPISDPPLEAALGYLEALEPDNTYVRGIRANVWEYALRKAPHVDRYRAALEADLAWILAARNDVAWRYTQSSTDWDNSCTQYAVLGLWAAERAGLDTGDAVWDALSTHFQQSQNDDGGFGYVRGGSSTANMATAGLASLYLVFDHHYGRKHAWKRGEPAPFETGEAARVLAAIDRGLAWLGTIEADNDSAYYLYGIERTAVAGGQRLLGGVDWFAEGAESVLRVQRPDGAIPLGYTEEIGTALSTLFLVYGGAPPAFAKLRHGKGSDWNLNPRDVAHLTRRLWSAYERPLNWHVVDVDAGVEDFEAPVLYISGSRAATFTDAQVDTLRRYIERGGTVLAEPADGSPAFRQSMVALLARLFPPEAYPTTTLAPLPADHAIYGIVRHDWKAPPKLSGATDGIRTVFLLSDGYLGADWQTDRVESDAFPLAMNILFHATALRPLDGRFAAPGIDGEAAPPRSTTVAVARAQHGSTRDWDAAAATWPAFADAVKHATGLTLAERAPVRLDRLPADGSIALLHLTGRRAFAPTPAEEAGLKRFVAGGGTVLVDPWGGSPAFAESARARLEALFGPLAPLDPADPLSTGLYDGGADLGRALRYTLAARRTLRAGGRATDRQHLEVARHDGRAAVVYSRHDLGAALAGVDVHGAHGYAPASARRVASNLVAWLGRGVEAPR